MPRPLPITSPTPAQPISTTSPSTSTPATNRPPFRYKRTDSLPKKQPEVWPLNEKVDEKAGSSTDSHDEFARRTHTHGASHSRTKSRQQSINASSAGHSSRHFPPPLSRPLIPPHHRQRSISRQPFTPMPTSSSGCSILPPSLRPWGPLLAWAATSLGFLIAIAFWRSELFTALDDLSKWLVAQGREGHFILGFLIFLTTIPPLPLYSTLIILAGYTYGAVPAFILSYLASLFGAFFVFQFSRAYLRAGTTTHAFPQSLRRVVRAIEKKPSLLFLIRLAPYPYNVLSYLLGAGSNINIGQYMTCTAVSLFKIIVHTTIGSEIHNFADYHVQPQDGEATQGNAMGRYWTIFGIALCVVLFIYLWIVARRAVDELDDSRDNCPVQRHGPIHPASPHPRRQEYAPFLSNEEAYSYDVEANVLFDSGMVESPFKPRGVLWDHQSQSSSPDHLYTDHFELTLSERGQSSGR